MILKPLDLKNMFKDRQVDFKGLDYTYINENNNIVASNKNLDEINYLFANYPVEVLGIVGSRSLNADLTPYLSRLPWVSAIISGGATGIDTNARQYALNNDLTMLEILPNYVYYPKKQAPLIRNSDIVFFSSYVLAFWNGKSTGTLDSINKCREFEVPYKIITMED